MAGLANVEFWSDALSHRYIAKYFQTNSLYEDNKVFQLSTHPNTFFVLEHRVTAEQDIPIWPPFCWPTNKCGIPHPRWGILMKSYLPQMAAILGVTSGRGSRGRSRHFIAPALTTYSGLSPPKTCQSLCGGERVQWAQYTEPSCFFKQTQTSCGFSRKRCDGITCAFNRQ